MLLAVSLLFATALLLSKAVEVEEAVAEDSGCRVVVLVEENVAEMDERDDFEAAVLACDCVEEERSSRAVLLVLIFLVVSKLPCVGAPSLEVAVAEGLLDGAEKVLLVLSAATELLTLLLDFPSILLLLRTVEDVSDFAFTEVEVEAACLSETATAATTLDVKIQESKHPS